MDDAGVPEPGSAMTLALAAVQSDRDFDQDLHCNEKRLISPRFSLFLPRTQYGSYFPAALQMTLRTLRRALFPSG